MVYEATHLMVDDGAQYAWFHCLHTSIGKSIAAA